MSKTCDKHFVYNASSVGLIRKITGTLVQGKIANSVTTAETKCGGVTSYIKFSGVTNLLSFQFARGLFPSNVFVANNLSGSPTKY